MAGQMLAFSGVPAAAAESKFQYKPTKRGGGGALRVLWWQGPTLLNPHFATGTKEQDASRIFHEPLARWDPDGDLVPVLAAEIPSRENGGLAADGKSVTWKLKRGVTWHDGKPFTADDVVFNWQYAIRSGVRVRDVRHLQGHQGREGRRLHGQGPVRQADAVLGGCLRRLARHADPEAPVRGLHRRKIARRTGQPEAGRHRSLQVRRLQAGRHAPRRDQHQLSRREPSAFRHHRDEGRRRCRVSRPRRHPDRRVRLCLEPAGRGRDSAAAGEGRQGPGHHHGKRQHRAHPAEQHRPVDRGRRRAVQRQDEASAPERQGRAPGDRHADRPGIGAGAHLRTRRRRHRKLPQQSRTFPLQDPQVGIQRRQGQRSPRGRRLEEGCGRHPGEGWQEAEIRLSDVDQHAAAEDPGDRQAGLSEGGH